MVNKKNGRDDSPLSIEEINRIDSTGLSSIDRHHLRLIAHSLACFKLISHGPNSGPLPKENERLKWLLAQPSLNNEKIFVNNLLDQLASAALQLETIADQFNISPLELTLEELIKSRLRSISHEH